MENWHHRSAEETLSELFTAESGLSADEAEKRLAENGANELRAKKKKSNLLRFFEQFKSVMVVVLLAAAVVMSVVAVIEGNYEEFLDVGIILAIVIVNAIIGCVQESKAESAMNALKDMTRPFAKVIRGGEVVSVESRSIVVGDIVVLEAGDKVPADLRLIRCSSLKIEESALTGESVPVEKDAGELCAEDAALGDRKCCAYSASIVTYGRGEGVVTATGMDTEMGKIAGMLSEAEEIKTPMQRRLDATGKYISIGVGIIAVLIFIIGILSNISIGIKVDNIIDSFMTAVAIAVAAIPEGLTAVITITMAIGVQRMSRRNAIVKKLPAVETLGSTEVICSDKTGTLTLNKMTVTETYSLCAEGESELKRCMALCNDTHSKEEGGKTVMTGDPTETALIAYYNLTGDSAKLIESCPRVDEVPFDSDRKLMTTVNECEGKRIVYTKGAPDILIDRCSKIYADGKIRAITAADKRAIAEANHAFAKKALRVLAYANKEADGGEIEQNLVFLGLSGMIDPPRPEVRDAVKICKKAGIIAVMITGDHRDTAFAIAKQLGIAENESQAITGAQLSLMSDEELLASVESLRVYARVSPEHKVRIVKAWRSLGKVVAMTGDGVNDAPSIKTADIGIGMGITGTDVTKEAADIVLADDNFATIVDAVGEGRKIFDNMQKTIQFLLGANIAEVIALFVATLIFSFTGEAAVFLLPIQILWINLITDSLPALALGMEESADDIMNHPPKKTSDNLFAGHVGVNILYQGVLQALIVLFVFFFATWDWGHEVASTMAFVTLSMIQLFHCFNCKSLNGTIFRKSFFRNKFMLLAFVFGVVMTVAVVLIPGLNTVFGMAHLTIVEWLICIGCAAAVIPLTELGKLIHRNVEKRAKK